MSSVSCRPALLAACAVLPPSRYRLPPLAATLRREGTASAATRQPAPRSRRRMNIANFVGPALASNDATNRLMLAAHAWRRDGALSTRTVALSVATDPVQQIQEMEHETPLAMDLKATLSRLAALPPSTE